MKRLLTILFAIVSLNLASASAEEAAAPAATEAPKVKSEKFDEYKKYKEIIDKYQADLTKVSPSVRAEITEFRKEVARLNKQKKDLYNKLSQEAQSYLKKDREIKKKLPYPYRKEVLDKNLSQDAPAPAATQAQ